MRPTTVPLPSFARIVAPSREVVWVTVGGVLLFRSVDRGSTWEQRPLPTDADEPEIAFASADDGWVMTVGQADAQCSAQTVTLSRTRDGGATYERLAPAGLPDAMCKRALSFVDDDRGFVTASRPGALPVIYRTTDGGATWTAATIAASDRLMLRPGSTIFADRVRAFGATLLVTLVDTSIIDPRTERGAAVAAVVYRSTDGGVTWSAIVTVNVRSLAFVTATRWIDLDAAGESLETTDAGASWHAFTSDYSQAAPIAAVFVFADDEVGYATVRGTIQRTVDGGAHWTSLSTPGT